MTQNEMPPIPDDMDRAMAARLHTLGTMLDKENLPYMLMVFSDVGFQYVSNCDKDQVVHILEAWISELRSNAGIPIQGRLLQ